MALLTKALAVLVALGSVWVAQERRRVRELPRASSLNEALQVYERSAEPNSGWIKFVERGADNAGARMVFEEFVPAQLPFGFEPGKPGSPPYHIHTRQVEIFEVLEGVFTYKLNGTVGQMQAGESVSIPPGVSHQFWNNETDTDMMIRITLEPALSSEAFFENIMGLQKDGYGSPLQMICLLYGHDVELNDVPLPIRLAIKHILYPFSKLAGYRTMYPQYTSAQAVESLKYSDEGHGELLKQ
mmetsp:Transcript_23769/g.61747  ORF Transcript_23769/g.61747 Transcript_23769/m.61747 type:complete len:242 (+) Transcript_23769:200-925(+)